MTIKNISIANDFTEFPAGRYFQDGPFSGQRFREEILLPALQNHDRVVVNIDGTLGFGSSFLEEAFGGLIRVHGLDYQVIKIKLEIQGSIDTYIKKIWSYIQLASK